MSVPSTLAQLPLFETLTEEELSLLAENLMTRRLSPGQILFTEGQRATDCFVVLDGTVGVSRTVNNKTERLAVLGSGSIIGHMALIDGQPRSATCKAEDRPALLLVFPGDIFDRLLTAISPFAFKILEQITNNLVTRLRKTTLKLATLKRDEILNRTPEAQSCAKDAAAELISARTSRLGLTPEQLDEISFEIPEGQS